LLSYPASRRIATSVAAWQSIWRKRQAAKLRQKRADEGVESDCGEDESVDHRRKLRQRRGRQTAQKNWTAGAAEHFDNPASD
jgi:hypothetical protein